MRIWVLPFLMVASFCISLVLTENAYIVIGVVSSVVLTYQAYLLRE